LDHRREDFRHIFTWKGFLPGEHLEQHRPESEDVRPLVHLLALRLLGAHVASGSKDHANPRSISSQCGRHRAIGVGRFLLEDFRQTKIQNLDLAFLGALDVRRFQVSVNDALIVCLLEGFGHLAGDVEGFFQWDGAPRNPLRQSLSRNELENEIVRAVGLFQAVDGSDVRMSAKRGP